MEAPSKFRDVNAAPESIDIEKLGIVIRKNLFWIILLFLTANLSAYLTIRWTKDLYESESELKLDTKQNAPELGIKSLVDDQNLNIIAGEIEQIKSKLFFIRVIDSLDLGISYYSIGKVLKDEMYKRSPFEIKHFVKQNIPYDQPVYFDFIDTHRYSIRFGKNGPVNKGILGEKLTTNDFEIIIEETRFRESKDENDYFFVINSRNALVEYLSRNISVDPLSFNANTIRISFKDFNALKARDIVNEVDSLYLLYSNEQNNLTNKQKIDWLNNELKQVEKKMQDFENYFENFTLKNKSSNVDDDLRRTIYSINKIDSQRYDLNKRMVELNLLMDGLSSGQYQLPVTQQNFLPNYLNKKIEDLHNMIQDQNRLGLAYNENTFAFKRSNNEISNLKNQIFSQLAELKNDWLKVYLELNKKKEKLELEFASMPDKNTTFSKNQRFYKLYEEFYLSMMKSKAEFEIAQAGSTPDFKILSSATLPIVPISPKKMMILGIGLVAGIVLNFFFIGLQYVLNNKITSIQELEKVTSLPVLGAIPMTQYVTSSPFHVIENPKSILSESIRTLRTNLDFFLAGENKKVISISSTISGEGKSFLALNLGGVLALSRKKVALLDLDMRKAKNNLPFKIADSSKGISTVLIQKNSWKECILKTSLENFDYFPSGPQPPNPSELLLNGEFSKLLEDLKEHYDYVVLDTPPIGLVTDGIMAMKRSDLSIYVLRANYSKKDFIRNLHRTVAINKFTKIALVLNALPTSGKSYGYGYYEERPTKNWWRKLINS
ncbi:MAG: polysaccharide biosynthesis tyrosine autokinase [Bacteroidota bacterium]